MNYSKNITHKCPECKDRFHYITNLFDHLRIKHYWLREEAYRFCFKYRKPRYNSRRKYD